MTALNRTRAPQESRVSTLEAARRYHARGWVPLPLQPRGKRPVSRSWPDLRPDSGELDRLFGGSRNVGIHLGPSDVVDIDLDCDEAVRLAPAILPPTPLRFGRTGSPASHWLYRAPGADYEKILWSRETLVELRAGAGKQTVMPPSIHPTGQVVRWERGVDPASDPATVEPQQLSKAVRRLAAACLLVREGWTDAGAVEVVRGATAPDNLPGGPIGDKVREWCGWSSRAAPLGRTPASNEDAKYELRDAAAAYIRDNPTEFPTRNSTCPVCGSKACFKAAKGAPNDPGTRWSCWSASHATTGVGVEGADHWSGDILDIDAHAAGMSVPDFLRARGYLRERLKRIPPPPEPRAPSDPAPVPEVSERHEAIFAAAEAALVAIAEAAEDGTAAAVKAWSEFLKGEFGLTGLAEAAVSDPDRADAIINELGTIKGLSSLGRSVRSQFNRLAKLARIEAKRQLAGLRVIQGGAQDTPDPAEMFERGDELEVAKRALNDYLGKNVVYDRSAIHRYDEDSGAWLDYERAHMVQVVQRYAGAPVFAGLDPEGCPRPPKSLMVSYSFASGAAKFIEDLQRKRGFFDNRAIGCGFRNGFLRADGAWLEKSATHRILESEVLPLDYVPMEDPGIDMKFRAPMWCRFLDDIFRDDEDKQDKIRVLHQFVGATMLGVATRYQMALMFYGHSAGNGKSTLLKVLASLFAPSARCSIPPHLMGSKHENVSLATARVNMVNDMPESDILDTGILKAIITGEPVTWNPKLLPAFTAAPTAGHIFAANNLPAVRDKSRGFWRRILILTFNRSFDNDPCRDLDMANKVMAEREHIAAACLAAALQMGHEGYTIPASSVEITQAWEVSTNNVREFAEQFVVQGDGQGSTPGPALFEAYRAYCANAGTRNLGRNKFYAELTRLGWKRSGSGREFLVLVRQDTEAHELLRKNDGWWSTPPSDF